MKKKISFFFAWMVCIYCNAQNNKNSICPYVCCPSQTHTSPLPDPSDPLVKISTRGIIIQFKKDSFQPYELRDLYLTIDDQLDYNKRINMEISSNDTTHGFVQSNFMMTIMAEAKDHRPVNINPKARLTLYIPSDSLTDDYHTSLFSGFRNGMGVMEWQYESEQDTIIKVDSCSYHVYHAKAASAYHIGKDVGLQTEMAQLKVKGFENPRVFVIYKNINVIDFERPLKKGIYKIPNNTDPFNTIVVIKAGRNGKNYFTELRLSEIKEGKKIKDYEITEKYFIELKNTDIKLRLF